MGDGPPCRNGPELNVVRNLGTKLSTAEPLSNLSETSDNLIHVGALGRVLLDHIGDKRLNELEAMIFLVLKGHKVR